MGLAVILAVQSVANIVTATILELELRFPLYFSAFSHRSGNCSRFSLALFVVSISALSEDHKLLFYAPCLCSSVAISRPRAAWDFWNPRENCPCTLQLDTRLGVGEGLKGRDLGERCLAGDEPKLGAARGCLASQIQGKGEVSHGPVAGLLLTDLLLVVGGLASSHACSLKAQAATERVCYLLNRWLQSGQDPVTWGLWQLLGWEMLWMPFCTDISSNSVCLPSKQAR